RRGNYVVNWGNVQYGQFAAANQGKAPFYHMGTSAGDRSHPGVVKLRMITDGTSNTLLMAEYLKALIPNDGDWRGDVYNDDGVFRFHTNMTPNTSANDLITSGWHSGPVDKLMPVADASSNNNQQNAARSRHPSGVNAALCDGSIRYVANDVNAKTWQALGTM